MTQGAKRLYFRNDWERLIFSTDDGTSEVNCASTANNLTDIRQVFIRNGAGDLVQYLCRGQEVSRSYSDHGHRNVVITKDYFITERILGDKYLVSVPLSDIIKKLAVYVQDCDVTYVNPR